MWSNAMDEVNKCVVDALDFQAFSIEDSYETIVVSINEQLFKMRADNDRG